MPELPDVEAFKRRIEKKALRKSVQRTTVHDERILDDMTASGLGRRLKSKSFTATHRRSRCSLSATKPQIKKFSDE